MIRLSSFAVQLGIAFFWIAMTFLAWTIVFHRLAEAWKFAPFGAWIVSPIASAFWVVFMFSWAPFGKIVPFPKLGAAVYLLGIVVFPPVFFLETVLPSGSDLIALYHSIPEWPARAIGLAIVFSAACGLFLMKLHHQCFYGLLEIMVACWMAFTQVPATALRNAFTRGTYDELTAIASVLVTGSIYVTVSGIENVFEGLQDEGNSGLLKVRLRDVLLRLTGTVNPRDEHSSLDLSKLTYCGAATLAVRAFGRAYLAGVKAGILGNETDEFKYYLGVVLSYANTAVEYGDFGSVLSEIGVFANHSRRVANENKISPEWIQTILPAQDALVSCVGSYCFNHDPSFAAQQTIELSKASLLSVGAGLSPPIDITLIEMETRREYVILLEHCKRGWRNKRGALIKMDDVLGELWPWSKNEPIENVDTPAPNC